MTHPYFVDKARELFTSLGLDPENSGALASWAEAAKTSGDVGGRGIIVSADGSLLAETRQQSYSGGVEFEEWNETVIGKKPAAVVDPSHRDGRYWVVPEAVRKHRLSLGTTDSDAGVRQLRLLTGQECRHVRASDVCLGSSRRGPGRPKSPRPRMPYSAFQQIREDLEAADPWLGKRFDAWVGSRLDVRNDTVYRWRRGIEQVPYQVPAELVSALRDLSESLNDLADSIEVEMDARQRNIDLGLDEHDPFAPLDL